MNTVLGLGRDTSTSSTTSYNFVDIAYQAGLLKDNSFSFEGDSVDEGQAHVTFGGYNKQDFTGDVDWFDMA